VSASLEGVRRS